MAFNKKTWKDTIAQYPTRRKITDTTSGTSQIVDVEKQIGNITTQGDKFNATTMNDLENRIASSLEVNSFTVPVSAWEDNTTSDKYVKKARISTDKYSTTFVALFVELIPDSGSFFSDDEESAKALLSQTVEFDASGVIIYATNVPSASLTFRIGGTK